VQRRLAAAATDVYDPLSWSQASQRKRARDAEP
jgi:hypothetical protein